MIRIRPVVPDDLRWVHAAVAESIHTTRWHLGVRSPHPDEIHRRLFERVLLQGVVEGAQPQALVQVHDDDLQHGVAKLGVLIPAWSVASADDLAAAIDDVVTRARRSFPLRKLYVEVLGSGERILQSVRWALREEGRLTDHERVSCHTYEDLVIHALWLTDDSNE